MKRIFVCSPFRGDVARNVELARAACRRIALNGDAPLAVHLYLPGALSDTDPRERAIGIACGLAWLAVADEVHVVGDAVTEGMRAELAAAERIRIPIITHAGGLP
jgi:hypothetical protein